VILAEVTRDASERADIARRLFCLLTEGEGENTVRRLAEVAEAIEVTAIPLDEIGAVADPFRAPGRSLLLPPLERPLVRDTVLDVSHESLIRQWQTLRDWVRAEAASAEHYRDIERRARRWSAETAEFLDGIDLDMSLAWREREHPTAPWPARYGGDFALAMRFLDESRARHDAVEAVRREQEGRIIAAEEAVARQQAEAEAERRQIALEAAEERAFAADLLAKRDARRSVGIVGTSSHRCRSRLVGFRQCARSPPPARRSAAESVSFSYRESRKRRCTMGNWSSANWPLCLPCRYIWTRRIGRCGFLLLLRSRKLAPGTANALCWRGTRAL
jgi:hypothetical protein